MSNITTKRWTDYYVPGGEPPVLHVKLGQPIIVGCGWDKSLPAVRTIQMQTRFTHTRKWIGLPSSSGPERMIPKLRWLNVCTEHERLVHAPALWPQGMYWRLVPIPTPTPQETLDTVEAFQLQMLVLALHDVNIELALQMQHPRTIVSACRAALTAFSRFNDAELTVSYLERLAATPGYAAQYLRSIGRHYPDHSGADHVLILAANLASEF